MAGTPDTHCAARGSRLSIHKTIIIGLIRVGLLLPALLFSLNLMAATADEPSVAVLYPDIRDPFKGVFTQIIDGIDEVLKTPVKRYALGENDNFTAIEAQLEKDHTSAVIALGRAGLLAAEKIRGKWPTVVGAVSVRSEYGAHDFAGITLVPDPEALFRWLKVLAPNIKRVTVVYGNERGTRSMDRAVEAAKIHGLILNALPAENSREAAGLYRSFVSENSAESDALWLLKDDDALDENVLLPAILKDAWEKNLVVFSSAPEHVKKGALFSLYPDNHGMGRSLASLTLGQLQDGQAKRSSMQPLRDLLIAVNLRTAEHLGLHLPSHEKRKFDLVFPSP
ncbi:ABC transporter substrate-binding protein [Methylomagnum sp.]